MDAVLFVLLTGLVLASFVYFIKEGVFMFSFTKWIRGIQYKIVKNWFDYQEGDNFPKFVPEPTHFTQGEKQYLQRVLAGVINTWEDMRKEILYEAQYQQQQQRKYTAHMTFKEHRKMKAEIKKLVSIQNKIKYTLETRG